MPNKIYDNICPLCEQINRCDASSSQGCWCMETQVPAELLAKIPAHLKGKTCICNGCIERHKQQQAAILAIKAE